MIHLQLVLEIVSVLFAVAYLLLASKQNKLCWLASIVSSAIWAVVSFYYYKLYMDGFLQLFYVATAIAGLLQWSRNGITESISISRMTLQEHIAFLGIGLISSALFGWLCMKYTDASTPVFDSFCTVFSILNTWLLVKKKLENWLYWIVIDVAMAYLFWLKSGYFYSGLYLFYGIFSIFGWIKWSRGHPKSNTISAEIPL
jgi:nicotinamide mononucleotide transporter